MNGLRLRTDEWRYGEMESWRNGELEKWRVGKMKDWKDKGIFLQKDFFEFSIIPFFQSWKLIN